MENTVLEEQLKLEDVQCSICIRILHDPITTPCGHSFCKKCLKKTLLSASKKVCALCRGNLEGFDIEQPNLSLSGELKKSFPNEVEDRFKEEMVDNEDELNKFEKKIVIGNTHEMVESSFPIKQNNHKWGLFIKDMEEDIDLKLGKLSDYIEKIVVKLHPTFHPHIVTLKKEPFEVNRLGWGTFTINLTFHFKEILKKPQMDFSHNLSFSSDNYQNSFYLEFDKRLCALLMSDLNSKRETSE